MAAANMPNLGNLLAGFSDEEETVQPVNEGYMKIIIELNRDLSVMSNPKNIPYIYSPLSYALQPHKQYADKYLTGPKSVLIVGINPGHYGMCQTGIPFGDIGMVRDWLHIEGEINQPMVLCPNRPIWGFQTHRNEESGKRLWGLLKNICGTPEVFFNNGFVYNYCPNAYMTAKGLNVTPDKLELDYRCKVEELCDRALRDVINLLDAKIIVAVGRYAERKVKGLATIEGRKIIYVTHPSPIVPNNYNWVENTIKVFNEKGITNKLLEQ